MNIPADAHFNRKVRSSRLKRVAFGVGLALLLVIISLSAYAIYIVEQNNFHTVALGQVYRSAQMNREDLARRIQQYDIKSIINLRGENLKTDWHQAEIAASAQANVVHYDWGMSAGDELSVAKMNELIALLLAAPKPVLIHCQSGADRTGLASALYCYAIEKQPPEIADGQLTVWYGHLPFFWLKEQAMDHSFWRYVSNHIAHAELNFRPKPISP